MAGAFVPTQRLSAHWCNRHRVCLSVRGWKVWSSWVNSCTEATAQNTVRSFYVIMKTEKNIMGGLWSCGWTRLRRGLCNYWDTQHIIGLPHMAAISSPRTYAECMCYSCSVVVVVRSVSATCKRLWRTANKSRHTFRMMQSLADVAHALFLYKLIYIFFTLAQGVVGLGCSHS